VGRRKIPEHVYNSIETLLPTAYNKKNPGTPGKLLELWAEEGNKSGLDEHRGYSLSLI
jgi:hypothetical protein